MDTMAMDNLSDISSLMDRSNISMVNLPDFEMQDTNKIVVQEELELRIELDEVHKWKDTKFTKIWFNLLFKFLIDCNEISYSNQRMKSTLPLDSAT